MPNKFILASAGAGKTTTLINNALAAVEGNQSVLILTYTQKNQIGIVNRIREINGCVPDAIKVKGWFSFLLEDLIRPYQRCFFEERISNIHFDQNDPHKENGYTIAGRSEEIGGRINPRYYLVNNKVYTTYISKLARRICDAWKSGRGRAATYAPIDRLASVYDLIVIDEVQDLVGWDFAVIECILANQNINLTCVGDFRQTIYQTSHASKKPQTSDEKRQWCTDKGFEWQDLNHSWRCSDQICRLADIVHSDQGYEATTSNVREIPEEYEGHVGVFSVSADNVKAYIDQFKPIILRQSRAVRGDLCTNCHALNFGEAKGLGFGRVLIIPTANYSKFLQGDATPLRKARTEEALNKLYVAITRARYSVAFLYDDVPRVDGITVWPP